MSEKRQNTFHKVAVLIAEIHYHFPDEIKNSVTSQQREKCGGKSISALTYNHKGELKALFYRFSMNLIRQVGESNIPRGLGV